ncbi:hypothetical protein, partial [uncultured Tateyamaria sp.]|uniref:hypothetical protein n=1 Tax=uncultured Tateyamaria sp. TaxID=455651 RepID=UPI00262E8A05
MDAAYPLETLFFCSVLQLFLAIKCTLKNIQISGSQGLRFSRKNELLSSLFGHMARRQTHGVDRPNSSVRMDLSRFDAAPLIAFTATKETDYGTET